MHFEMGPRAAIISPCAVAGRREPAASKARERNMIADQAVTPGVTGTVKWKTAPRGLFGHAHKRPPCDSTILRLSGRPMPVPSGLVVKNASKMRSAPSAGSPMPESLTETIN
jgi:hypothetical protein